MLRDELRLETGERDFVNISLVNPRLQNPKNM